MTAHPAAEYYTYTVERPGQEERTDRTNLNSVKVVAVSGENCIEVVAVASGGAGRGPGARVRPSPVRGCTAVTRDGAPVATGGHPHGQKSGS